MKKIFVLAAMATVVFASCQKSETAPATAEQAEVGIIAFNDVMTKAQGGYTAWTTGKTTFQAIVDPESEEEVTDYLPLYASAYAVTSGNDFFVGKKFTRVEDPDDATKSLWHANPKIYYPLGGDTYKFVAYTDGDLKLSAAWDGAKKCTIEVTNAAMQKEVLYAFSGEATSAASPSATMDFNHSQAWINVTYALSGDSATDCNFKVTGLEWKNVYDAGEFIIEDDGTTPGGKWNFFTQVAKDVTMSDDVCGVETPAKVSAAALTTTAISTNMLFPAQKHTGFVLNYTVGEDNQPFSYEYKINEAAWEAGKKYIYNISVTISEVTIKPTIVVWAEGATSDIDL